MTCSTHTRYWLPCWPSLQLLSVAIGMATTVRKMLLPLALLPRRSPLLSLQTQQLRLRPLAPWHRRKRKLLQDYPLQQSA